MDTGKEKIKSFGIPYEPSDKTPIDTQEPSDIPDHQSRMWSTAALAADIADDIFLASITAAPLV